NVMNILPGTTVVINKLNIKDLEAVDIEMNLIKGKIRNDLKHKFNSNSKFEIRTPNSVIGVRGTNFLTGYDPDNFTTEIITFEGTVWFRKLSTLQQGFKNNEEVLVGPSEKSDNVKDGAPGAAAKVPDDQIKKLLDETEVLNPKDKKANKNKKDADASSSSK
ncbi:MAG: FecR domain-containing protein, partial [Pseudobdellovibrio sp.]